MEPPMFMTMVTSLVIRARDILMPKTTHLNSRSRMLSTLLPPFFSHPEINSKCSKYSVLEMLNRGTNTSSTDTNIIPRKFRNGCSWVYRLKAIGTDPSIP